MDKHQPISRAITQAYIDNDALTLMQIGHILNANLDPGVDQDYIYNRLVEKGIINASE